MKTLLAVLLAASWVDTGAVYTGTAAWRPTLQPVLGQPVVVMVVDNTNAAVTPGNAAGYIAAPEVSIYYAEDAGWVQASPGYLGFTDGGAYSSSTAPLPNGEVLIVSGFPYLTPGATLGSTRAMVLDTVTGAVTLAADAPRATETAPGFWDATLQMAVFVPTWDDSDSNYPAAPHVLFYDPSMDTWSSAANAPQSDRGWYALGNGLVKLGNGTVVMGASEMLSCSTDTRVDLFDPATDSWSAGPAIPSDTGARGSVPMGFLSPSGHALNLPGTQGGQAQQSHTYELVP